MRVRIRFPPLKHGFARGLDERDRAVRRELVCNHEAAAELRGRERPPEAAARAGSRGTAPRPGARLSLPDAAID